MKKDPQPRVAGETHPSNLSTVAHSKKLRFRPHTRYINQASTSDIPVWQLINWMDGTFLTEVEIACSNMSIIKDSIS